MEHTKHIWRAAIILLMLPMIFITVRHFMIPDSFWMEGHYRYDSLREYMDKPVIHGNTGACAHECHEKQEKKDHKKMREEIDKGKHSSISCEVCHAPLSVHVRDGKKVAVMPQDKSSRLCAYCHQYLKARPKSFLQVDFDKHLKDKTDDPNETCITTCHNPHNPKP